MQPNVVMCSCIVYCFYWFNLFQSQNQSVTKSSIFCELIYLHAAVLFHYTHTHPSVLDHPVITAQSCKQRERQLISPVSDNVNYMTLIMYLYS